ncbi:uncharacterized protein PG998_007159 [Apiospora kogelbergensis]|uniref:uncharacterized protein n=1 Tax=Apiospora kogelbergensis TaxID=1337665 RepID=UPI00312CD530
MSAPGAPMLMPVLEVPHTVFNAVLWIFVAVSGIALSFRLIARGRGKRIFWDDGIVLFSWLLSLAIAVLWQWAAPDMYYIFNVQAGLAPMDPVQYMISLRNWLNTSLVVEMFFYTILCFIKLAFLIFFQRLGRHTQHFMYVWWGVLFVTVGTYLASIGNINYKCLVGTIEQITVVCQTEHEVKWTGTTLKANAALDVLTDFLSRSSKKVALLGLFSLTMITVIVAIIRAVMVDSKRRPDGNPDVSWLWFWSAVEPSVAIMVCCGSAFPQLFTSSTKKKPEFSPSATFLRLRSRIRSSGRQPKYADGDSTLLDFTRMSQNGTPEIDSHPNANVKDDSKLTADSHRYEVDTETGYAELGYNETKNIGLGMSTDDARQGTRHVVRPVPAHHYAHENAPPHHTQPGSRNQVMHQFELEGKDGGRGSQFR